MLPGKLRHCRGTRGTLAGGEVRTVDKQLVELRRELQGVVRLDQQSTVRCRAHNFALTGSVGRDDRKAGVEVLEDFIGDGEVAARDGGIL